MTSKQERFLFHSSTLCHSFLISVIPSKLLSFLPDYCHFFQILSFLLNYFHSFRIIVIHSELVSVLPNYNYTSKSFPYPKGEKIGQRMRPYLYASVHIRMDFTPFYSYIIVTLIIIKSGTILRKTHCSVNENGTPWKRG